MIGGRAAREIKRTRTVKELDTEFADKIGRSLRWLVDGTKLPKTPKTELENFRIALRRDARTLAELQHFESALHERLDGWNALHPGQEIPPLPAMASIPAMIPAWSPERMYRMRMTAPFLTAFEARIAEGALPSSSLPFFVLASAVFDSACLSVRDLTGFAGWLADPHRKICSAPDLPAWIDIRHRADRSGKGLRVVSGIDDGGPYALRRLFLDGRTLNLLRQLGDGGVNALSGKAARQPKKLIAQIQSTLDTAKRLPQQSVRDFMRGAEALLEVRENGPDHAMVQLAARRMETWGATTDSWESLFSAQSLPVQPVDIRTLETDASEVKPFSQPVIQMQKFLHLHQVFRKAGTEAADMSTSATKLASSELAARIRALRIGPGWPDCLRLLADWYMVMLSDRKLRVSTIQRYHATIAIALCGAIGCRPFSGLNPEDFEELYTATIESDIRSGRERVNLRKRLQALHRFGMDSSTWDFPPIDDDIFGGPGEAVQVRANILSFAQTRVARQLIRTGFGLKPEVAQAADSAFLFTLRCGTRLGETVKALLSHLEDPQAMPGLPEVEPTLFIRPSVFGNNKSRSAYRQIRPFRFFTADEAEDFAEWVARRRLMRRAGPLFGVEQPDGSVRPFSKTALGELFSEALAAAGCPTGISSHSLRRAGLNWTFLALHEHRNDATIQPRATPEFLERLTGWTRDERRRVSEEVVPSTSRRDIWHSLARHAGHADAVTTFSTYITVADLAIYQVCARQPLNTEQIPQCLASISLHHRRIDTQLVPPEVLGVAQPDAYPAVRTILDAMELLDQGYSVENAANATWLNHKDLRNLLPVARAWADLRTTKGHLRLQPRYRIGKLAPDPLPGPKHAVAIELAEKLIKLERKAPARTRSWILRSLMQASRTNSGTKVRSPEEFQCWLDTALALYPASRWFAEIVVPKDRKVEETWRGIRPSELLGTRRFTSIPTKPYVRIRLSKPGGISHEKRVPARSWAGCVRFACHLAAICLGIRPNS